MRKQCDFSVRVTQSDYGEKLRARFYIIGDNGFCRFVMCVVASNLAESTGSCVSCCHNWGQHSISPAPAGASSHVHANDAARGRVDVLLARGTLPALLNQPLVDARPAEHMPTDQPRGLPLRAEHPKVI